MSRQEGVEAKPQTLREVGRRLWLETLNLLAEYGSLLVFSVAEVIGEAIRKSLPLTPAGNAAAFIAEGVTAATMIAPKGLRVAGEILQVIFITGHDIYYTLRHGTRRPKPIADSGKQKRVGGTP